MSPFPWIIIAAVGLYGLVHSVLASRAAKARARVVFGAASDRYYRLLYNVFAGLSFLPVLALLLVLPHRSLYRIPVPWVFLALLGQLLAGVLLVIGLWQTGASQFLGLRQLMAGEQSESTSLEVQGLYSWVRHPLYTAGLILIWLTPVMTDNILALNLCLTLYIFIGAFFEEKRLVVEFGQAYRDYQRTTPMIFPRVFPRRKP